MKPDIITLVFIVFDILTFVFYLWDKLCAKAKWRRIPERILLTLSIPGGLGGILAMVMASHKIRKTRFTVINSLTCILQAVYVFYRALL